MGWERKSIKKGGNVFLRFWQGEFVFQKPVNFRGGYMSTMVATEGKVEEFFEFLKGNKLGHIANAGEKVLLTGGPKGAIEAAIKAMQCCGNYSRWTPMDVRNEVKAMIGPIARNLGIPHSDFIMIV